MKNVKLGIKLIGGFCITAVIILGVGLLSIIQQGKLAKETEQLGKEQLPAVEYILAVKNELGSIAAFMRTLLTPYATKEQLEHSHQQLVETRKRYRETKEKFAALHIMKDVQPEWEAFNTSIDRWVEVNNQAVELSKQLISMDMTKPELMKQHMAKFEVDHNNLLTNIAKLLLFGTTFDGGTDDTACALGKWIGSMDTTNPTMVALVNDLKPVHSEFHKIVAEIKILAANGQLDEAKQIYDRKLLPISQQVFVGLAKMNELADSAVEKISKLNTLLLIDGATHQANTFSAIDKMVDKVDTLTEETVDGALSTASRARFVTIICLVVGVLLAVLSGLILTRMITKPLFKGVDLAEAMSHGDLTRTMDVDQKDEIGVLARSLNEMAGSLRRMFGDISQNVTELDKSSTQLATISNQMTAGAESTASRSSLVAAAAEEMSSNQSSIAAAMEQASVNISMVASATEEMSSTINEIASNSSKAKEITSVAVNYSLKASERVNELGKAANEINKVTEVITEISEQTNLLALNATIEAARAGEAGKGFAVVANEIKDLAKQTAAATLDIKTKIQGVQEATGVTVKEIEEIGSVITDVDNIVATIAAAVEEQTATTSEISKNVQEASQGIAEVNENVAQSSTVAAEIASDIATVNDSATEMTKASNQVKLSASELANISEKLKEMMTRFKI